MKKESKHDLLRKCLTITKDNVSDIRCDEILEAADDFVSHILTSESQPADWWTDAKAESLFPENVSEQNIFVREVEHLLFDCAAERVKKFCCENRYANLEQIERFLKTLLVTDSMKAELIHIMEQGKSLGEGAYCKTKTGSLVHNYDDSSYPAVNYNSKWLNENWGRFKKSSKELSSLILKKDWKTFKKRVQEISETAYGNCLSSGLVRCFLQERCGA